MVHTLPWAALPYESVAPRHGCTKKTRNRLVKVQEPVADFLGWRRNVGGETLMWAGVIPRFHAFHQNLCLTESQITEGRNHQAGVRRSLNNHYYCLSSNSANSFLIGSWGKYTRTRPPRDIDVYFVLPYEVYRRFEFVQGNKQSALLQEIKRVLQGSFPNTNLRGDGQVVVVAFNRMSVEVVPAVLLDNGQYFICDTHDGGRYKTADPKAELTHITTVNENCNGNLRPLIMMLKAWQGATLKSGVRGS